MTTSAIYLLEKELENQETICSSTEALTTFPPILFQPFHIKGIGIIVCLSGFFTFKIGDKTGQAKANETFFFPNEQDFQVISHSNDLRYHLLLYQIEPIRDTLGTTITSMYIYTKIYPHRNHVYQTGQEEDFIRYLELINHTRQQSNRSYNYYEQKLLLISLTYRLCSVFQHKMQKSQPANVRRTEVFLQLISLINKYYNRERGVEFYADKLCLSPKYLSGLSKSVCGYTVQELVFKAIIRESKSLLTTTGKTIQEISDGFKFTNASSFGTFFKKQTGTSPQKYREQEEDKKKTETREEE